MSSLNSLNLIQIRIINLISVKVIFSGLSCIFKLLKVSNILLEIWLSFIVLYVRVVMFSIKVKILISD